MSEDERAVTIHGQRCTCCNEDGTPVEQLTLVDGHCAVLLDGPPQHGATYRLRDPRQPAGARWRWFGCFCEYCSFGECRIQSAAGLAISERFGAY